MATWHPVTQSPSHPVAFALIRTKHKTVSICSPSNKFQTHVVVIRDGMLEHDATWTVSICLTARRKKREKVAGPVAAKSGVLE